MRIEELMASCAGTPEGRMRAIFNALFTICNRLQALFDGSIPEVTLRPVSYTHLDVYKRQISNALKVIVCHFRR